ncbi:MAG: arginine--tRNA ligase [Pirellulaceae bacterium]|nr:arginine--tRNA ligase [Pirellulaceae bacterium]
MNLLAEIRQCFAPALESLGVQPADYLGMIRPAQDKKFGDYQVNFAMGLAKALGKAPREIAGSLVETTNLSGLCSQVEIAGPGFINLRIDDEFLRTALTTAVSDDRLGVAASSNPLTIVIDYSSPNVAKPMHVGHIRSTVIGDALARIARFVGHHVISDNHLGDWGTQFGMIIYGYKHFRDQAAYRANPVQHLGDLYRRVRQLGDYHSACSKAPQLAQQIEQLKVQFAQMKSAPEPEDKGERKQKAKEIQRLEKKLDELNEELAALRQKISAIENVAELKQLADEHARINQSVLEETAKLHAGDADNLAMWREFLPSCMDDINSIYKRLDVGFDQVLGESFYHDQLQAVVDDLKNKGMAEVSDGAMCVFLDNFETPMLIQKSDGAFLYATTDLATIKYRVETWSPDIVLYVVDHRQQEHFDKLFAVAARWGYATQDFRHVSFGTVLGEDGRPFKTRSGDTVGLAGLLDEAERKAKGVLIAMQKDSSELVDEAEIERIAQIVGIGALKFADLSQHRSSDYTFSYDKMLELKGFTATYAQYLYARVQGIYRRDNIDPASFRTQPKPFLFEHPLERELGIMILQVSETLDEVLVDYRPNLLAQYLFELTQTFFKFYDQCPVLTADSEKLKASRLQLCDLAARTIRLGLGLLGIGVVDKM